MQSTASLALAVAISIYGCGGSRLQPQTQSSSAAPGYALGYPSRVDSAVAQFEHDSARAQELAAALPTRGSELKLNGERALVLRVIDEADAAGRSQRMREAVAEERAQRRFWDEERAALSARVGSATQKQAAEKGCSELELQGAVSGALRDGLEQRLERRMRAENEAQRTLELNKARLAPGSLPALQRLADDVARASQLANVALVDDLRELDRLTRERRAVAATLERALDEERAIQAEPHGAAEQRSSQERVVQIEKSRAALEPSVSSADAVLVDHENKLAFARSEYQRALAELKQRVPQVAPQPLVQAPPRASAKAVQKPGP